MRCLIRETARTGGRHEVGGWRQWRHVSRGVKALFDGVRSTRRARGRPERVEAYLARCGEWVERAAETRGLGSGMGAYPEPGNRLSDVSGVRPLGSLPPCGLGIV